MSEDDKNPIDETEEMPKPKWHKIFEVPLIGDSLAFIVAATPAFFAQMTVNELFYNGEEITSGTYFVFSLVFFLWNLTLWIFLDLLLKVPIIPIPWFVVGLGHLLYQTGVIVWSFFKNL